jgi:MoaA/NifB/PqqE/SkfB family radical SAM enzyme
VITNGTHWNSKIEKVVNELNFDLAVSIDAFDKEKLERIRKNVVYEKLMDNITRFSEICNRKGKHFSLSFTVQKDNWEQLPLIINLCNEAKAFTYVSYLERPQHFSIADLNKDELKKVRAYMEPFSFPKRTQKERHNANCFEDFKHYLDTYIQNAEVKKYHDYEFHQPAFHLPEQGIEEKNGLKLIPLSANDFSTWVAEQYAGNQTLKAILPQETFLQKANTVLSAFSEEEKDALRGFMHQTDFTQIANDVKNYSEEELRKSSATSLSKYYEQA